jgi:hypothetical protein
MLMQSAGEDLCVSNFMVANSGGNGVFDREHFRGHPDPLSDGRTGFLRRVGARAREQPYDAIGEGLRQVTPQDILGWFRHAGLCVTQT